MRCLLIGFLALVMSAPLFAAKSHWHECIKDEKPLQLLDLGNTQYKITQCTIPAMEFGDKHHRMGKCKFKYKPSALELARINSAEVFYGAYEVREKYESKLYKCAFPDGYVPVKGGEFAGLHLYAEGFQFKKINGRHVYFGFVDPVFLGGVVQVGAVLTGTEYDKEGNDYYHLQILTQEGDVQAEFRDVQAQIYEYKYSKVDENPNFEKRFGRKLTSVETQTFKKTIFPVGEGSIAFLTSNWDRKLEFQAKQANPLKSTRPSYRPRHGEVKTLHLYDTRAGKLVNRWSQADYQLIPMLVDDGNGGLDWNIVGTVDDKRNLFGILSESGEFVRPPGSLGLRPVMANYMRYTVSPFYGTVGPGTLTKDSPFWLVAYPGNNGSVLWGMADSALSEFSEPLWSEIREDNAGWMYARRLSDSQWEVFDGNTLNAEELDGSSFEKLSVSVSGILKAREEGIAAAEAERSKKRNAHIQAQQKAYFDAKARGDQQAMRQIIQFNSYLRDDFFNSGFGTIDELQRYIIRQNKPHLKPMLEQRLAERQSALQQAQEQAAMQRAQEKLELENAQREARWARKREELEAWRAEVRSNARRVNRGVNDSRARHEMDMYKKGYITDFTD